MHEGCADTQTSATLHNIQRGLRRSASQSQSSLGEEEEREGQAAGAGVATREITPLKPPPRGRDLMPDPYNVTEFILLGLSPNQQVQRVCFAVFLLLYAAVVLGNLLLVLTVAASTSLASPMYFFLGSLSLVEICYSSTTAPKLLSDLLARRKAISVGGCMAQLFFLHFFGGIEMLVLTAMAYDRYVAICRPLHYAAIMNRRVCAALVGVAWAGGLVHSLAQVLLIFPLPFCGPNVIDHYFCDVLPLLQLACSDTFLVGLLIVANGGTLSVVSFVVLLASYVVILVHLRTRSSEGRRKALSTCGSHVTVVTLFFAPCVFIYLRPSATLPVDKLVAVFYTVITPLLNPVIYSLRNAEVKRAVKNLWTRTVQPVTDRG
ncbi:Olfactory receptor 4X2 [Fukomys damarensis]|uniref:Olfactory receptor n=1 Tax=Fukomys damarensis TaxID=885580 RepID=A0A091CQ97_FUKDA|nr:Olfactory receptor 4X2 [Fukomys damarensis]